MIRRFRITFERVKRAWAILAENPSIFPVFSKKTHEGVFLFFLGLVGGISYPCFGEQVRSLVGVPVDQIPSQVIRESLQGGSDRWVDPRLHPALPKISDKLVETVQSLWKKSDGNKPIYVFITDDLYPNAVARGEDGATYVGVSLGLLGFVENDAELKFAIGQQLERAKSKVKAHREAQFGKGTPKSLGLIEEVIWHQLNAAEDVESDIRSVVERMVDKGENPYPAEDFLLRWENQLRGIRRDRERIQAGDSTKRQALGMAISALGRGMGRYISRKAPKKEIAQLADEFLGSKEFEQDKATKLREAFNYKLPGVSELYWNIHSGDIGHWDPDTVGSIYKRVYDWRWKWLARYIEPHKLKDQKFIEYQFQLHASVSKQFDQVRKQAIPEGFKPDSIEVLDLLTRADSRKYESGLNAFTSNHPYASILLGAVVGAKKSLAEARSEGRPSDFIQEKQKELTDAEAMYRAFKRMHEGDVHALAEEALSLTDALGAGNTLPERLFEIERELEEQVRYVGKHVKQARHRMKETVEGGLPLILEEIGQTLEHADKAVRIFDRLDSESQRANRWQFLNAAVNGYKQDLKNSQNANEVDRAVRDVMKILQSGGLFHSQLVKLMDGRFDAGAILIKKVVELGLEHAKTLDQVARFFPREVMQSKIFFSGGVAGDPVSFSASTPILNKILDDAMVDKMFQASTRTLLESREASVRGPKDLKDLVRSLEGVENLTNHINAWEERGLIDGNRFRDRIRPAAQNFINAVEAHLGQLELTETKRVVQSLLSVRYPSTQNLVGGTPPDNPGHLMHDIWQLANESRAREAFAEKLSFSKLARAVGLTEQPRWDFLNWLKLKMAKPVFFKFISDVGPLVGGRERNAHGKSEPVSYRKLKEAFGMYCLKHCPDKNDLVGRVTQELDSWLNLESSFIMKALRIKYQEAKKQHRKKTGVKRHEATVATFFELVEGLDMGSAIFLEAAPKNPSERIRYIVGLRSAFENSKFRDNTGKLTKLLLEEKLKFQKVDTQSLIDFFASEPLMEPSSERDALFELIWKRAQNKPDLRAQLYRPKLVETLYFEENQELLAKKQLDHLLGLEKENHLARQESGPPTDKLRDVVEEAKRVLDEQYPKEDIRKDRLLDYVEKRLQTSPAESDFLDEVRLNHDSWVESPLLKFFQLPEAVSENMESNQDRLELLEYLLQKRTALPDFVRRHGEAGHPLEIQESFRDLVKSMRRGFREGNVYMRTYALLPLLDHYQGVLRNERMRNRVLDLMLGDHAHEPVYRAVVEAYLSSSELSDQRVVMAHALSAGLNRKEEGKPSFVRNVLEGMGPFGIRAGQFIRANGLGSPELLAELDHFFDNALPPNRRKQIEDARKIFGDALKNVRIREVKGSGALNYVMEGEIYGEGPSPRRVAVRVQRDHVFGRIANENRIWKRAIETLRQNPDPTIRKHANIVDEARVGSMHTLNEKGAELNLAIERQAAEIAKQAYDAPVRADTGFRVRAVAPIEDLQQAVPQELQEKVSIYELIDAVPIKEVNDPALRAKLSRQIVEAELEAMFDRGIFDPDGHPGNWLVDLKNKELVRVDYAQIRQPPSEEVESIKRVLDLTLMPHLGEEWKNAIVEEFDELFTLEKTKGKEVSKAFIEQTIGKILKSSRFPSHSKPANRLFFLRQQLEDAIEQELGTSGVRVRLHPTTRAALGSLSRLQSYLPHLPKGMWRQLSYKRIMAKRFNIKSRKYATSAVMRFASDCVKYFQSLGTAP